MKLLTVHVTNFRSAEDSEKFDVEPITCLVGKNESGKSAILLALAALNPHEATPAILDKERDYPRRSLTQYDQKHAEGDAVAVTTTWKLEKSEVEAVASAVGDEIQPFVALFSGNDLHVAVLSDQATGDKQKVEDMKRSEVLRAGHFHTVADFLGRAEADVEDIFDPDVFVAILNSCYELRTLTNSRSRSSKPPRRPLNA